MPTFDKVDPDDSTLNDATDTRVFIKKIRMLYDNGLKALTASLFCAFILVLVVHDYVRFPILAGWMGLMSATLVARIVIVCVYRRSPASRRYRFWAQVYMLGAGATGVVWGLASPLFFFHIPVLHQAFLVVVTGGMLAGATATLSFVLRVYIVFALPEVIPLCAVLLMAASNFIYLAMGLLTVIFTALMLGTSKLINRSVSEAIGLHFENVDLIGKLKESELKFRTLTDNTTSAIFILQDQKIKYVNRSGEEITGYAPKALYDEYFWTIVHPKHRRIVKRHLSPMLNDNHGKDCSKHDELKIIRQDNTERWIDFTTGRLIYQGAEAILGTAFDITPRKLAQEQLFLSERRYRHLFNAGNDAVFVIELSPDKQNGYFVDVNHVACKRLGYSREELLGMRPSELDAGKSPNDFYEMLNMLKEQRKIIFETVQVARDGTHIPVEIGAHYFEYEGIPLILCLARDIAERKLLMEKLTKLATTDPLTGAFNRRHFYDRGNQELSRAQRYGKPLVLLMMDIDFFKQVNDTYGHLTGDEVLKNMVNRCRDILRLNDIFGRLGGEEFAALLLETDAKAGYVIAERLRQTISQTLVQVAEQVVQFTVSIGLSVITPGDHDLDKILMRADQALYYAKSHGRNQVVNIDHIKLQPGDVSHPHH